MDELLQTHDGLLCKLHNHPYTIDKMNIQKFVIKPRRYAPLVVKFQVGDDIPIRIEVSAISQQINCSIEIDAKYDKIFRIDPPYTYNNNPFLDEYNKTGKITMYIKLTKDLVQVLDKNLILACGVSYGESHMKYVYGPNLLYLIQPFYTMPDGSLLSDFDVIVPMDNSKKPETFVAKVQKKSSSLDTCKILLILFLAIVIIFSIIYSSIILFGGSKIEPTLSD